MSGHPPGGEKVFMAINKGHVFKLCGLQLYNNKKMRVQPANVLNMTSLLVALSTDGIAWLLELHLKTSISMMSGKIEN